jgi:integrase
MPTVGELFDAWLAHVDGRLEVATVIGYRSVVRQLRPLVGGRDLSALTVADLDGVYVELLAGPRSAQTVHRHHRVFHAALRQAVRWGWLASNPADAASPPRLRRRRVRPPTAGDVVRLIDAAASSASPDLAVALRILVATGMRRGEVCGLRWRDVDLATGTLRIESSVVHAEVGIVEKDTKTHAARRLYVDGGTVAGRLGHADPSTTLWIYAAFMEPADQGAARIIEGLLHDGGESTRRISSVREQS